MKKYIIIAFLATPLHAANQRALPAIPDGPPLQTILDKHSDHRTMQQLKKAGTAGAVTVGAYGLSKTDIVHQLFPELFPRSGTSTIIIAILGVIAGSGGIWVLRDKFEEWGLRQKATEDMLKSSKVLEKLLPVIEEIQKNQAELENDMSKWGPKVNEALENSIKVREGYEAVLASVETIVGDMGDDHTALGQITALKDQVDGIQTVLYKTRTELRDTTELTNEMALAHIKDKLDSAPPINELARMANELKTASKKFEKVPQKSDTSEEKIKRRWWRP